MVLGTHPRSSERHEDILRLVQSDIGKVARVELDSSRRRGRLDLGLDAGLLGDTGSGVQSATASSRRLVVILYVEWKVSGLTTPRASRDRVRRCSRRPRLSRRGTI